MLQVAVLSLGSSGGWEPVKSNGRSELDKSGKLQLLFLDA
jgi:hypothetical protein